MILLLLWLSASLVGAQPSWNYQVQWERDFARFTSPFFLQGAGADAQGNLWVLTSAFNRRQTLFRIDAAGNQQSAIDIEARIPKDASMDRAEYYPAITPAGPAGFLVNVLRARGRSSESRGTFFSPILISGSVGSPVPIYGAGGPSRWGLIPLSDGDLLTLGDQSPLVIQKISPAGEVRWQRRFSKWLDIPDAAAMPDGASCVVSSEYPRIANFQELHLLRLDASGRLRAQTQFHGHLARVAAGPNGACAVFYYDYLPQKMDEARYHFTVFNPSLTQQWTKDIPATVAGRTGMVWYLITAPDGYLASGIAWNGDLFLAKYSWSGDLRWLETRKLSCQIKFVVPSLDGFYLIGESESPQGPPTAFKVTKLRFPSSSSP